MPKTNPTGVRFDTEKLEFIKGREKLSSNQQVVDLLMNKYWWEHKMPVPTHREAPPLHLKQQMGITSAQPMNPTNTTQEPPIGIIQSCQLLVKKTGNPIELMELMAAFKENPKIANWQYKQIDAYAIAYARENFTS